MRTRVGKLAWSYEKKLKEGKGGELARGCWKDSERKRKREGEEWSEGKEQGQREMVGRETGILQIKGIGS